MVSFLVNHITLILIKQMMFLNHYSLPYVIRKFQASLLELIHFFMVDMVKQIWGSDTFIDYTATCNLSVYFVLSDIKIDGWRESIIKETIVEEINGLWENCKSLECGAEGTKLLWPKLLFVSMCSGSVGTPGIVFLNS